MNDGIWKKEINQADKNKTERQRHEATAPSDKAVSGTTINQCRNELIASPPSISGTPSLALGAKLSAAVPGSAS